MLGVLATASVAQAGIYPDDHWNYATKLSSDDEYDALVQSSIDAGQTLFIRWIASEG